MGLFISGGAVLYLLMGHCCTNQLALLYRLIYTSIDNRSVKFGRFYFFQLLFSDMDLVYLSPNFIRFRNRACQS
mgnify:FL=1